jgi:type IV secretion system protein VirB4
VGKYYQACGLNERQRELLRLGTVKRDYYVVQGHRAQMTQLDLGPLALALCGSPGPAELRHVEAMIAAEEAGFVETYLTEKGVQWLDNA